MYVNDYELDKIKPKDEEQEKIIDDFLEQFKIPKTLRGYIFLKQMVTYILNDDSTLYKASLTKMYDVLAKANKTTWYNIMRLSRYACKKSSGNKVLDTNKIIAEAFYKIKMELNEKKYEG